MDLDNISSKNLEVFYGKETWFPTNNAQVAIETGIGTEAQGENDPGEGTGGGKWTREHVGNGLTNFIPGALRS